MVSIRVKNLSISKTGPRYKVGIFAHDPSYI